MIVQHAVDMKSKKERFNCRPKIQPQQSIPLPFQSHSISLSLLAILIHALFLPI
jgi:hypothetical protein